MFLQLTSCDRARYSCRHDVDPSTIKCNAGILFFGNTFTLRFIKTFQLLQNNLCQKRLYFPKHCVVEEGRKSVREIIGTDMQTFKVYSPGVVRLGSCKGNQVVVVHDNSRHKLSAAA